MSNYRNHEWYFDPTAGYVISKISREERKVRKKAQAQRKRRNNCDDGKGILKTRISD